MRDNLQFVLTWRFEDCCPDFGPTLSLLRQIGQSVLFHQWLLCVRWLWRPLASKCFRPTLWPQRWRSSPSSCPSPRAQPGERAAPADHVRLDSKRSLSPLLRLQRWRRRDPHRWRRRERVAPSCSLWRTCGGALRPFTAHLLPIIPAPPHLHRVAWTPATLTPPSETRDEIISLTPLQTEAN